MASQVTSTFSFLVQLALVPLGATTICLVTKPSLTIPTSYLQNSSSQLRSLLERATNKTIINRTSIVCTVVFDVEYLPSKHVSITLDYEPSDVYEIGLLTKNSFTFDRYDEPIVRTKFIFVCQQSSLMCNELLFDYITDKGTYDYVFSYNYNQTLIHHYRQVIRSDPHEKQQAELYCFTGLKEQARLCKQQVCLARMQTHTIHVREILCGIQRYERELVDDKLQMLIFTQVPSTTDLAEPLLKFPQLIIYTCNQSDCNSLKKRQSLMKTIIEEDVLRSLVWPSDYLQYDRTRALLATSTFQPNNTAMSRPNCFQSTIFVWFLLHQLI